MCDPLVMLCTLVPQLLIRRWWSVPLVGIGAAIIFASLLGGRMRGNQFVLLAIMCCIWPTLVQLAVTFDRWRKSKKEAAKKSDHTPEGTA